MDQGPRSWHIDEAGGKVGKTRLTQRHRALQHVGITLIPAYSPEARGRSECAFQTLLDRLPNELALRLDHGEGGGQPQPGEQFSPPTIDALGANSRSWAGLRPLDRHAPRRNPV
jgi:hypothetical protein